MSKKSLIQQAPVQPVNTRPVGMAGLHMAYFQLPDNLRYVLRHMPWYVLVVSLVVIFGLPLYIMIITGLKAPESLYARPFQWIPFDMQFSNYVDAWTKFPFTRYLFNTLFITGMGMIGAVLSTACAGYAMARIRFPAANLFFAVLIGSMLLPGEVTLIPEFVIWWQLGFVNTYVPLIVPGWLAAGAPKVFLLRQFFRTIPRDLEDAAKIDGASVPQRLLRVMGPLAKPALGVVLILEFVAHWNKFVDPLIYLKDEALFTLNVGLNMFRDATAEELESLPNMHLYMAIATLIILPILVIFLFLQRYFIDGIQLSGMKG